ncbi:MAG: response regulator transcription factor [Sphingopyxis sp.]|nr:response regulator transcription factor [Sphingopyxis sp.]
MAAKQDSIRIMVVDDHPVLREGIAAIIANQNRMTLVGEARNGAEAISQFRALRPDVTLIDIQMPVMNGVDAIAAIREEFPSAKLIVLTTYSGDAQAVRALRAGASGYLLKSSLRTEMLDAIVAVHRGQRHVHREVADNIAHHVAQDPLSAREIAVLELVATGRANRQIGEAIGVSEETVKAHLKSIFAKLGVSDRTHAVALSVQRGIIDL